MHLLLLVVAMMRDRVAVRHGVGAVRLRHHVTRRVTGGHRCATPFLAWTRNKPQPPHTVARLGHGRRRRHALLRRCAKHASDVRKTAATTMSMLTVSLRRCSRSLSNAQHAAQPLRCATHDSPALLTHTCQQNIAAIARRSYALNRTVVSDACESRASECASHDIPGPLRQQHRVRVVARENNIDNDDGLRAAQRDISIRHECIHIGKLTVTANGAHQYALTSPTLSAPSPGGLRR